MKAKTIPGPRPRNFVAKHAHRNRGGAHVDRKKADRNRGGSFKKSEFRNIRFF